MGDSTGPSAHHFWIEKASKNRVGKSGWKILMRLALFPSGMPRRERVALLARGLTFAVYAGFVALSVFLGLEGNRPTGEG